MSNISELRLNSLDFDSIKQNIIDYFKDDPTFTDYDFEGAGLNALIDIMAYNTHINGIVANMSANEMFLDSAQLRQSVISHAKTLAYTPTSCRASKATIRLSISKPDDNPAYILIPKGFTVTSPERIIFSTNEDNLAYPTLSGKYEVDIDVYEGSFITQKYETDYGDPNQRFILSNTGADTSTLIVTVIENEAKIVYSLNKNISLLKSDSFYYFLHQNPDNKFEVTFGDGVIGYKPIHQSQIQLEYILSSKLDQANGISVFLKNKNIPHGSSSISNYTIQTINNSAFGADQQSTNSIRTSANKMYKAQSRAVTTFDYENFILSEYPFIEDLAVWGGEYNVPPEYGKVFLSLKAYNVEKMSNNMKLRIRDELIKKYNVVTVYPEIIDPDYTFIRIITNVDYNYTKTSLSDEALINEIRLSIEAHFNDYVSKFKDEFYISKLTSTIDSTDASIIGSITSIKLEKRIYPKTNFYQAEKFSFDNEIVPGSIVSSFFNDGTTGEYVKSKYTDNGLGTIEVRNALTGSLINKNIGTVDYSTGSIRYTHLIHTLPPDTNDIRIYATPKVFNVKPSFNKILKLDVSAENPLYGRPIGVDISVNMKSSEIK